MGNLFDGHTTQVMRLGGPDEMAVGGIEVRAVCGRRRVGGGDGV